MKNLANSFRLWLVVFLVVFGVIVATGPTTPSVERRIAHLESIVRCPACEGLSVAQSNATSSVAVRHEIERRVKQGDSDTVILTSLQDRYGPSILLSPSGSGVGVLLWLVPLLAVAVGVVVVVRLVRKQ